MDIYFWAGTETAVRIFLVRTVSWCGISNGVPFSPGCTFSVRLSDMHFFSVLFVGDLLCFFFKMSMFF